MILMQNRQQTTNNKQQITNNQHFDYAQCRQPTLRLRSVQATNNKLILFIFLFLVQITPTLAHTVKTDANVGATFHIEPNHNPRAGEPNRAWFALTRQGGKLIPLRACDCELAVKNQGKDEAILNPELTAISVEQYTDIPGANIIFPQAGIYELVLKGSPKSDGDFLPFQLSYTVTVTPAKTAPVESEEVVEDVKEAKEKAAEKPAFQWGIPAAALGIIIAGGMFWGIVGRGKK